MQFVIYACDSTDEGAFERRMAAREEHLKLAAANKEAGKLLYASALLDDSGRLAGSVEIMEFDTRKDLDEYLNMEPYVRDKVWGSIEIKPGKVPPLFS